MDGWVKLHRCLMKKPVWINGSPEQKVILITILMLASHEEKKWKWKGQLYELKPGQFVTSIDSLATKSGTSKQNVRTALKNFEIYEFLTNESTKSGRLITIVNWELYQSDNREPNNDINKDLTKSQQRPNKDLTPIKNIKNIRKEEEKKYIYSGTEYSFSEVCEEIVNYLNLKAGVNYKPSTQKTKDLIKARLNDGFGIGDFQLVIDNKVRGWINNPEMRKFLRPETLFSNKFEGYLNEKHEMSLFEQLDEIARYGA